MSELASIKLVVFDGKKESWQNFERKFKAFLTAKKLKKAFATGWVVPKKGEELGNNGAPIDDKVKEQELNESAYNLLLLSMDSSKDKGQVAFDLVTSTETVDYPDGNFVEAWKKLSTKYYPTTVTSMKEVEKEFNEMKLKGKTKDPEVYYGKLQVLRARLNSIWSKAITDEELILRAADGLTKDYQPVKRWVERNVENQQGVTEDEFINEVRSHFKFLNPNGGKEDDGDDGSEAALTSVQKYSKPFKGKCNGCGKWGHMKKDCRLTSNGSHNNSRSFTSGAFKGKCNYCGIFGHKEAECRKKKAKGDGKTESAHTSMEEEVVLVGIEEEDILDMKCLDIEEGYQHARLEGAPEENEECAFLGMENVIGYTDVSEDEESMPEELEELDIQDGYSSDSDDTIHSWGYDSEDEDSIYYPVWCNPKEEIQERNSEVFDKMYKMKCLVLSEWCKTTDDAWIPNRLKKNECKTNEMTDRTYEDMTETVGPSKSTNESCEDDAQARTESDWRNWYKNVPESSYKDYFTAPNTFEEAWDHPDPWQRHRWRAAINKEFDKMNGLNVWKKVKRTSMAEGRKPVKHKWVLEIKRSGIFRARLVACGYSQVPGIDFTDIYSPVSNDVTFILMLINAIRYNWSYLLMDVETAFLLGKLSEEIYMECPKGMTHEGDEVLLLLQTIYGLVQSAREFFRLMVKLLKKVGFNQSAADPCLLIRTNGRGTVMISLYVDDCFVIGDKQALEEFKADVQKMDITVVYSEGLKDYLSCEIVFSGDGKKAWLGQPHLINKLRKSFGDKVSKLQVYRTPGTPGGRLRKPTEKEEILSEERQSQYRSGVGLLMYLVKWSRPDIANATRELAKLMSKANEAAEKELFRIIKYVLDTADYGLKIAPVFHSREPKWRIITYSDSTWADDPDDRVSVSGCLLYVNEVLVKAISRKQKAVSLSSSEAEFYACAEAAKEIKFVVQLMLTMRMPVILPIVVMVDNIGAIFLAENATSAARTRHIDTRYKFIREMTEDAFLKMVFVRSELNRSDGHTKNLGQELHDRHSKTYVWKKSDIESVATAIVMGDT